MEQLQDLAREYGEGRRILGNVDFSDLTEYAVKFQYGGMEKHLAESEVFRAVSSTIERFMEHSEENSGLELPRYRRGDPRPVRLEQEGEDDAL